MSAEHILTETRDRVLYVTINRVEKHNALARFAQDMYVAHTNTFVTGHTGVDGEDR